MHSAAYVWRDAAAERRRLRRADLRSTAARGRLVRRAMPGAFVARCGDATVRVGPAAADGADGVDDVAPLTFGGLARGGNCAGARRRAVCCRPDHRHRRRGAAPSARRIADAAASVISWRLDGIGTEALGVDSRGRAARRRSAAARCSASRLRPVTTTAAARPRSRAGCADGTVAVMRMVSAGGGREAPTWARPTELATSDGAAVVQFCVGGRRVRRDAGGGGVRAGLRVA